MKSLYKPCFSEINSADQAFGHATHFSKKHDGYFATYTPRATCFLSSEGNEFVTPASHQIPPFILGNRTLCGELIHKDGFQATGLVKRKSKVDWTDITFWAFDLHESNPVYQWHHRQRELRVLMENLTHYATGRGHPNAFKLVKQHELESIVQLHEAVATVQQGKHEGLVLVNDRSLLADREHGWKWKNKKDMDGIVAGYVAGEGRCAGMKCGSLLVEYLNPETYNKSYISVGSGLNDHLRNNPPPVGAKITFEYRLLSTSGVPQKPTFKHVRE